MKTTVDIPDELASELSRRAAAGGRDLAAEVVALVRKGLAVPASTEQPTHAAAVVAIDPVTGLPVVHSPPGAPISRLTTDEILNVMRDVDEEEDLERFARSLRR